MLSENASNKVIEAGVKVENDSTRSTAAVVAVTTNENPITCPLILQCRDCKVIVGDTCTIIDLNRDLRTITIQKKAENVKVDEDLHTSKEGVDFGSTFHILCCKNCNAILGRTYRTTSPELDIWRGHYTFSSDVLIYYELPVELMPSAINGTDSTANTTTGPVVEQTPIFDSDITATSTANNIEIVKLQKFCLLLFERITKLETELNDLTTSRETLESSESNKTPTTNANTNANTSANANNTTTIKRNSKSQRTKDTSF